MPVDEDNVQTAGRMRLILIVYASESCTKMGMTGSSVPLNNVMLLVVS